MDNNRSSILSSMYGGSSGNIGGSPSNSALSPYLNFDPALLNLDPESQFIPLEGASHRRGRFEMAFSQIGGSVCIGAGIGGLNGIYSGLKETKEAQLTGAVRRTQMLNYITKKGASSAQKLGVVALMYSATGVILYKLRGADDELNTLSAGALTGCLYKSTAGLRRCMIGGAVGFSLATVYCLVTSRDRLKSMIGLRN